MARSIRLAVAVLTPALLLLSPHVAVAGTQGSFERSYSVTGAVDLEVLTHSGDISIRAGQPGTVTVRGKIHVGDRWRQGNRRDDVNEIEKNPPIRQSGNSLHIDYLSYHDISVDYEITAPPDTALRAHTGSGNQELEGLRGTVDVETDSGDLRLRNMVSSRMNLRSGSGDIVALEVSGPLAAEAGSGNLRVEESGEGDMRLHTGSGNVEVHGVQGALWVQTGSGNAKISGTNTGPWEVRTGSGDVDLALPAAAAFDLEATTGSGSIVTDRTVSMTVQGDLRKSEHTIRGKVGGGGPQLMLRTGSGDVRIH